MTNKKKTILIVDDAAINRSMLADMLCDEFSILEADNGLEAAHLMETGADIALVLLDLMMPVMDGFSLLSLMNERGWIKRMPVIMISAATTQDFVHQAYDLGALEYIGRPFDERTVRRRVMTAIMLTSRTGEAIPPEAAALSQSGSHCASDRTLQLLEREQAKLRFFAELSQEIWFEYSASSDVLTLSDWSVAHLGLPEVIPHPGQEEPGTTFFRAEDFRDLMERLRAAGPEHPVVEATYALTVGGSPRWSKVQARSIWVGDLAQLHYEGAVGKIVDIHEDTEQRVRLQHMADTDALTGLLNHRAAKNRISALLADQSEGRQYALILFDLDNFKMANDIYGHLFGDEVLRHVADTVRSSFRSSDITARMGGDEFLIFLEYKDSALPLVQRIFQRLCVDFKGFSSSVSMGVAYSAQCGGNYEKLFQMADIAMYEVKRNGKRNFRFYDADK